MIQQLGLRKLSRTSFRLEAKLQQRRVALRRLSFGRLCLCLCLTLAKDIARDGVFDLWNVGGGALLDIVVVVFADMHTAA